MDLQKMTEKGQGFRINGILKCNSTQLNAANIRLFTHQLLELL